MISSYLVCSGLSYESYKCRNSSFSLFFSFFFYICLFFFFQAEDGIRDLVRSRGLGDVYKRQPHGDLCAEHHAVHLGIDHHPAADHGIAEARSLEAVSYTHLTLPTSDLV